MKKNIKEKIIKLLESTENMIGKFRNKLTIDVNENEQRYLYEDLMPKDNVSRIETYINALDWAININERVKNIALSGPYGAGKSTIIQSYIKSNNSKEKFLNISLASFSSEKIEQQIIEKSILEQMIYRVDGKRTPYSRFKKIQKIKKKVIWNILIIGTFFLGSGVLLYNKDTVKSLQDNIPDFYENSILLFKDKWLTVVLSILFSISLIIVAYNLIKVILKGFKIAKIKFDKTEIELGKDDKESIYDKYLDELLYFFEETEYEVVIFEDLDRFNEPAIFTNLRKINTFLNNYENITRRIIFLYAIKDDMFSDKERTKFFDFIIPVIPFTDSFNSRQIVLNSFNSIKENAQIKIPSDRLIKDITIFLDDMRMLTNIINEYIIYYKQTCGNAMEPDKLLSIIVYKNLYPKDFYELQYNRGMINAVFDQKSFCIERKVEFIQDEIDNVRRVIELSSSIYLNSIKDLILVFKSRLDEKKIDSIRSKSKNLFISINENLIDNRDLFSVNEKIIANRLGYGSNEYTYNEIFTAFEQYDNLFDMADAIKLKNNDELELKKNHLNNLLRKKYELQYISLKDLANEYKMDEIFGEIENEKLLVYLIKEGHIDETYRHYISYFYPGAITLRDMEFLRNLKINNKFPYEYELDKVDEIIKDISLEELKGESILNNYLVNYLLKNIRSEESKFTILLESIMNNLDSRIEFINQFCKVSVYRSTFVNEICKKYTSFWYFILSKSNLTKADIDSFWIYILDSCDLNMIIELNENNSVKDYIVKKKDILQLNYDIKSAEKLIEVFKNFNIKFNLLNTPKEKYSIDNEEYVEGILVEDMILNNRYNLNIDMTRHIYEYLVNSNKEMMDVFELKNYSAIKNIDNKNLLNHINEHLEEYLREVFLKLPNNNNEEENLILEFLNNDNINDKIKKEVIKKSDIFIDSLLKIPTLLWDNIIEEEKIIINWHTIMHYFKEYKKLSSKLVNQINEKNVYEALTKVSLDEIIKSEKFSEDFVEKFNIYFYENEDFVSECFLSVCKSLSFYYVPSENNQVSNDRIKLILDSDNMEFIKENYLYIREKYNNLQYAWVVDNFRDFIQWQGIELKIDELKKYLKMNEVLPEDKVLLVNSSKNTIINNLEDCELLKLIFKINKEILANNLDNTIFGSLIKIGKFTEDRIILFANKLINLNESEIKNYLNYFDEPINMLSDIDNEGSDVVIEKNSFIKHLLEKLHERSFIKSFDDIGDNYKVNFGINTD